jgi:hypothetical protein
MAYLTVNFTDATKGPFSLATLFAGGTITGVTLTPAAPAKPPRIASQVIIQGDPANSTNLGYVGTDATMLPTAGGGVGYSLSASGVPLVLTDVALTGVFLGASANGTKINVITQGGFQ